LTRSGTDRFWVAPYNVYYDEALVGTCSENRCTLHIAIQP